MALNKDKEIVTSFPVVMFSKTYCGYCRRAKELLTQLGPNLMRKRVGQRAVPNVFIGGKHFGGCDALIQKHQEGTVVALLTEAGAIAKTSVQL
ncbi:hypothetical protein Pint_18003 [Pistacia integerrima]|uniref:Uncharacterized protein n=1 Tax=Pistacia integerrima TaxID=434235 RepID=A0ACC0YZT5_9ROSI|nr:hypothetical protein Pint_18003 [Pistacia integerrima]